MELAEKLISIRRQLHRYPELSLEEYQTTKWIREWVSEAGIKLDHTNLQTGVFATIQGEQSGPTVAIRADIDALPIEEQTELPFASENKGKMHACGHDFHTAAVLGAGYLLQKHRAQLSGSIKLLFQPAEEIGGGADRVIHDGQLNDVDYIIGLHNKPNLPVGTIGISKQAMMAAVDRFQIHIQGKGGHAGIPHVGKDPIITATQIVSALQTMISRNISPFHPAVLSVTKMIAGNTWNVIPETAELEGTLRTFDETVRKQIKQQSGQIVEQIGAAFGQKVTIHWYPGPAALINDEQVATVLMETANSGGLHVIAPEPSMAGEDFSSYLQHVPGGFVFFGTNGQEDWHHPKFTVDEAALLPAATFLFESAKALLNM